MHALLFFIYSHIQYDFAIRGSAADPNLLEVKVRHDTVIRVITLKGGYTSLSPMSKQLIL